MNNIDNGKNVAFFSIAQGKEARVFRCNNNPDAVKYAWDRIKRHNPDIESIDDILSELNALGYEVEELETIKLPS